MSRDQASQLAGIEAVALDMWEPYVQSVRAHVPEAGRKIVFDRYHIMTHMGKAVDDVRKREHRAPPSRVRGIAIGVLLGAAIWVAIGALGVAIWRWIIG